MNMKNALFSAILLLIASVLSLVVAVKDDNVFSGIAALFFIAGALIGFKDWNQYKSSFS